MPHKKIPPRTQVGCQSANQHLLSLLIEIDHNVATEYAIKWSFEGIAIIQVQSPERDGALEVVGHLIFSFRIAIATFVEIKLSKLRWNLLDFLGWVNPSSRNFQDSSGDVRGKDPEIPFSRVIQAGQDTHGQSVGFLPGGTPSAPYSQSVVSTLSFSFEELRKSNLFEVIEVLGLSKEIGEVRRDGVQKVDHLG